MAKRDVGVVRNVRPEKVLERERQCTGNEDDDPAVFLADSPVERSYVFQWYRRLALAAEHALERLQVPHRVVHRVVIMGGDPKPLPPLRLAPIAA